MIVGNRLFCIILFCYVLIVSFSIISATVHAEMIERVVAIVNDEVILLSEFNEAYENAKASRRGISREEFLDEMIDRELILEQAKKFRFKGSPDTDVSDNMLIEGYLERRIKAFIHIQFADVENYYLENPEFFKGKSFYDVQDEIESLLIDQKLSIKISDHMKELRDNSHITLQLHYEAQPLN